MYNINEETYAMTTELGYAKDQLKVAKADLESITQHVEFWSEKVETLSKPQRPEEPTSGSQAVVVRFGSAFRDVHVAVKCSSFGAIGQRDWLGTWDRPDGELLYMTWDEVLEYAAHLEGNVQAVYDSFVVEYVSRDI